MKRVFKFKKENGGHVSVMGIASILEMWCKTASAGEYIITMERCRNPRSIKQNNLMWMWFEAIAREWSDATGRGYTKEQVKDMYCTLFLPVCTPAGTVGGSTSGLTTEQMTEFLGNVQAHAATEYGIQLPSPDDCNLDLWMSQYR